MEGLPAEIPAGGPVRFPETAEQEAARVGRYFAQHELAKNTVKDTYGDEDSSLPDFPHGDR